MTRPDSTNKYHMYTRYVLMYVCVSAHVVYMYTYIHILCVYVCYRLVQSCIYSTSGGELGLYPQPSIISVSTASIPDEDKPV